MKFRQACHKRFFIIIILCALCLGIGGWELLGWAWAAQQTSLRAQHPVNRTCSVANAAGAAYNPSQDIDEGAGGPEASEEPVKQMDDEEDDEEDVSESISESVKLDEWANEAGKKGTDTAFETDIDFMMNVISGGLNKRKSTGQTTIPVIAHQTERMKSHETTDINESADPVSEWKKLAGI